MISQEVRSPQAARREQFRSSRRSRLERMVEIRSVEDAMLDLFGKGLIPGTMHTCQGQEAVAVGIAAATTTTDVLTCTYRGHGHALALGLEPQAVIGEVMGRKCGSIGGVGGSMHLCAPAVGLLPTSAIVGAGIPLAVGAALSSRVLRKGSVAVAVFGDGTTNIGAFHESMNLAKVWRLPVIFVCENNLYGSHSALDRTTSVHDIARRAAAYDMPSTIVDGQDVDDVESAMVRAVARARSGEGPTLVEAKTYRYAGHSRSDKGTYRPAGELEAWKARDPIELFARRLMSEALLTEQEVREIKEQHNDEIARTVEYVTAQPRADTSDMLAHVFTMARGTAG